MNVVLDTNVLVSAVLSPGRKAFLIVQAAIMGEFQLCYDQRMADEYQRVLRYPKFHFTEAEINDLLDPLLGYGLCVKAAPIPDVSFERDETDRKFYEVAKYCRALLVTGNLTHYPAEDDILNPATFCGRFLFPGDAL